MKTGFFTMEDARTVAGMKDLNLAKQYALDRIKNQPAALPHNVAKATQVVEGATSLQKLVLSIGSFVMAHPSEGLKVLR